MTSTLSGLVLGIIAAAAITVFYGDTLNHVLQEYAHELQGLAAPVTTPAETGQASLPESTVPASAVPAVGKPDAAAADALLAQKWNEFAQNAESLQVAGDFRWRECFQRAAAIHGIAEPLLLAVASGESGFDPAARSSRDAIGLMQIRWPDTGKHLGVSREADLYDPCTNVLAGAKYLAELVRRYPNDLHRAVAAYNYGPGRIDEGPLPQGAQWYSHYIYQHLEQVLGQSPSASSALLPIPASAGGGYHTLMSFNQPYRARDFLAFLEAQEPGLSLAQRRESLGRYEVVLLYQDEADRQRALEAIARTGLVNLD